MTSYLRNIFGEQPTAANHSKSHHNPRPTPRNRDLSYIYALPGIPSSSFSPPILERGYPTYESGSVRAQSQDIRPQQLGRAPLYRHASDMAGEHRMFIACCSTRDINYSSKLFRIHSTRLLCLYLAHNPLPTCLFSLDRRHLIIPFLLPERPALVV